jgi:hypothetical protein
VGPSSKPPICVHIAAPSQGIAVSCAPEHFRPGSNLDHQSPVPSLSKHSTVLRRALRAVDLCLCLKSGDLTVIVSIRGSATRAVPDERQQSQRETLTAGEAVPSRRPMMPTLRPTGVAMWLAICATCGSTADDGQAVSGCDLPNRSPFAVATLWPARQLCPGADGPVAPCCEPEHHHHGALGL